MRALIRGSLVGTPCTTGLLALETAVSSWAAPTYVLEKCQKTITAQSLVLATDSVFSYGVQRAQAVQR